MGRHPPTKRWIRSTTTASVMSFAAITDDRIGRIAPGFAKDLVAVAEDLPAEPAVVREISLVLQVGEVIREELR